MSSNPIWLASFQEDRKKTDIQECPMMTEAEIGVRLPHAKEPLKLPEAGQERHGLDSPSELPRRNQYYLCLQASRNVRE